MTKDKYGNAMPEPGDTIMTSRGLARVIRVHPFGTVDILLHGRYLRMTGLGWL